MQNRAVGRSQRFCKAISIYSWSSQDVGVEVFDVLTIFFSLLIPNILFCLASTASLISFPKWVNSYYLFRSCYFLLWNQQLHQQTLWFLRGVLYFFKKRFGRHTEFYYHLNSYQMYGCFTRGNHKKRDILQGRLLNLHSYDIWKYSSRWCSRVSGNVAPFRSVIFYILWLQYLWQGEEDV